MKFNDEVCGKQFSCKMLKSYEYQKGKLWHVEFTKFIFVFTAKLIKYALALVFKLFMQENFLLSRTQINVYISLSIKCLYFAGWDYRIYVKHM